MATKKTKKSTAVKSTTAKKKTCATKKVTNVETEKKSCSTKSVAKKEIKKVTAKSVVVENNNAYVVIDYPVENETIYGDNYVLRIGASNDCNGYVEVSFNNGEWQLCRFASGYWWYDWTYFKSGNVKISARLVSNDGKIIKVSDIRKCKVC